MKANKLPEKIYIHKSQYWGLMANENNITKIGVEYIRKDTFIEKAVKYIANHFLAPGMDNEIKDFVNYMKRD